MSRITTLMHFPSKILLLITGLLCAAPSIAQSTFKKVTNAEDIVAQGIYILVCESNGQAMGAVSNGNGTNAAVTITDGVISTACNESGKPYTFSLGTKSGKWVIYQAGSSKMLSVTKSNATNLEWTTSPYNNQHLWTIKLNADGTVDIQANGNAGASRLLSQNTYFKNYSTSTSNVCLYRQYETVNIGSKEGFSTLYSDKAYFMPAGVEGATIIGANGNKLEFNYCYTGGDIVPNGTPLILRGTTGSYDYFLAETANMYPQPVPPTPNMLRGSAVDEMTSTDLTEAVYFYKMSYYNGAELGFYWGELNGGAFLNKAGRAYLVLAAEASEAAARGFSFSDAVTDITNPVLQPNQSEEVFTVSGHKQPNTPLRKGLYIINGRKTLIR